MFVCVAYMAGIQIGDKGERPASKALILTLVPSYTAARLAQLGERWSAEREVVSSNPRWTNTQGLKITEAKVLSL